jgi:phage gpG-like protein
MAPKNVKMTYDAVPRIQAAMRALGRSRVLVGIPAENGGRTPEPGSGEIINNAALGYIHENGSPAANIPARPFLVPGIVEAQEQIADTLESSVRKMVSAEGSRESMAKALHSVGLVAVSAVRRKLTDGPFAPLAPRTLAKRKARGVKRTKPLIDTGQMRNSITYVVEGGE